MKIFQTVGQAVHSYRINRMKLDLWCVAGFLAILILVISGIFISELAEMNHGRDFRTAAYFIALVIASFGFLFSYLISIGRMIIAMFLVELIAVPFIFSATGAEQFDMSTTLFVGSAVVYLNLFLAFPWLAGFALGKGITWWRSRTNVKTKH